MSCQLTAVAETDCLPEAGTVHDLVKALHAIGNEVRLRFLDALRMVYDGNLFYELGYSSFHQYCDRELGLRRSTCLEYVRAVKALDGLPRLRVLYCHGELSWDQVRAITRVATRDTEIAWIELAFGEPVRILLAEISEARRTGSDSPRDRRVGLPNIMVRLWMDLTIEEKERVRAALELVGAGTDRDGEGHTDPRPPVVRWADGVLSGDIPSRPTEQSQPKQTILYRTCPECRRSTLDSAQGPIEIAPERVAELEPASNVVRIDPAEELPAQPLPTGQVDQPNSKRLARQVVHRDGLQCANPACGRRHGLQSHHIVFRSDGGRTALSNEVAVCRVCHSMLHKGLLEVSGSVDEGLEWHPRPISASAKVRDVGQLRHRLAEIEVPPAPARADGNGPRRSAALDERCDDLAEGLVRLGWSRADSRRRIRAAMSELGGPDATDEAIIMKALKG